MIDIQRDFSKLLKTSYNYPEKEVQALSRVGIETMVTSNVAKISTSKVGRFEIEERLIFFLFVHEHDLDTARTII